MKLVQIGKELVNIEAVARITKRSIKSKGQQTDIVTLHLSDGTKHEIIESDLQKILDLTGNVNIPDFGQAPAEDWSTNARKTR